MLWPRLPGRVRGARACRRRGRVVAAEHSGAYGNMVEIEHPQGVTSRYAHLASIAVVGQGGRRPALSLAASARWGAPPVPISIMKPASTGMPWIRSGSSRPEPPFPP